MKIYMKISHRIYYTSGWFMSIYVGIFIDINTYKNECSRDLYISL
jgi:hypothetical protein